MPIRSIHNVIVVAALAIVGSTITNCALPGNEDDATANTSEALTEAASPASPFGVPVPLAPVDAPAPTHAICQQDESWCAGSCVSTASNPHHCGACGATCARGDVCIAYHCAAPATPEQLADRAAIEATRPMRFTRCTNSAEVECGTGCVNLLTNADNCGTCGQICAATATCLSGTCR